MACGNLVNMLLLTKVTNYLDFKKIEGNFVFNGKNKTVSKVRYWEVHVLISSLISIPTYF